MNQWSIDVSLIGNWLDQQSDETLFYIQAAFEELEKEGPNTGRPTVDHISHSKLQHMKELKEDQK